MAEPNRSTTLPKYSSTTFGFHGDGDIVIRRSKLREEQNRQWERHIRMNNLPTWNPHDPGFEPHRSSINMQHPNTISAQPLTRLVTGPRSGFLAFGERNPRRHGIPSLNANVTHANAPTTYFNTEGMDGTPGGILMLGPPYPLPNRRPSFNPNITHPNIWIDGNPTRCVSPEAALKERWGRRSAETPRSNGMRDHSYADAVNFLTAPSSVAGCATSRQAHRAANGMAGPGKVVSTVTRVAQHTISASEVFREVRECVIEYLGSDVER